MQTIAEQLADLSFPQEGVAQTLDRQTLVDAWHQLLENVGEDQLAEIDTVHQSGNRIDVDFQDGSSAVLTCLSSGAEVDQFDAGGDLLSNNWWNTDGSYFYDIDGSFTNTTQRTAVTALMKMMATTTSSSTITLQTAVTAAMKTMVTAHRYQRLCCRRQLQQLHRRRSRQ